MHRSCMGASVLHGCIVLVVGDHPFNACIGLVVGVFVLSWVHWSCCGCIGLVVWASLSSVHRICRRCIGLSIFLKPHRFGGELLLSLICFAVGTHISVCA